jgi:hypothetical protein
MDDTDIFDKLAVSAPINRQAAMTLSRGFVYEPDTKVTTREWEAPPKMRLPANKDQSLAGTRFGRLTAIGIDAEKVMAKNTPVTWVCRCDCGRYTSRSAKAIKNPKNQSDRCALCRHAKFLTHMGRRLG